MDYDKLIAECDSLLKAGKINQVSTLMSELNFAQVPRTHRQGLAKICRRAVLTSQGLRLLHPIIRQTDLAESPATSGEICEYSVLLLVNGSVQEAMNLLESVNPKASPEALLYLGFCEIGNWEYKKAADHFQKYLALVPDDYSKLIAQVNLASCDIVLMRLDEAQQLLDDAIQSASKARAFRLLGNCHELMGQVFFWKNDFIKARASLKKAHEVFAQVQTYDQLLIYKTESIMKALEQNSIEPLSKFRDEACARKHWDSVREADLFSLKVQFDQNKFDHLVYGTPMPGYRERISQIVAGKPSSHYFLGSETKFYLDLKSGNIYGSAELNPGRKIHQVLAALVTDLYVPVNIGTLFSKLYPDEFFNVNSSPGRVRQILMRVRKWLKDNQIPMLIEQSESTYRLEINGNFGIRISLESDKVDPTLLRWQELKQAFPIGSPITLTLACEKLGWSRSMFHRVIDWALEKSLVEKSGVGRSTHYSLVTVQTEKISKIA